ncbi:MAG: BspA family leucine-rich repeat surface protein [Saprospiraceae bacterium]
MNILNSFKILFSITLLIALSLPTTAQVISETAGTTTTIDITGGELFSDPNDGTQGGPGGVCTTTSSGDTGDYPNCNCVTVTTLTAPAGQQVSVTFFEFRVGSNFDWLAIFDGSASVNANNGNGSATNPTSSDPLLWNSSVNGDELVDMLNADAVTFTSTNGSLTFASRFSGVVNTCGWEAEVDVTLPFVTTWKVDNDQAITIPLQSVTYDFDYTWTLLSNDPDSIFTDSGTHTNADGDFTTNFPFTGTYQLEIIGEFPHLRGYPVDLLLDVLQWGSIPWRDMGETFQNWPGAGFTATDAPDLSRVTNMRRMFLGATNFNEDLNHWDVSNVTSMAQVFQSCTNFDGNISDWDVSKVTFFFRGFSSAKNFNQDISNWDVSSVDNMESLLDGADKFNQPIGKWDVRKVTRFRRMLANMDDFDQSIGNWQFRSNADFSQFASGTNNVSCQNWSTTILGWNFNNPDVENLPISGFNADYDAAASAARDELVARGWTIIGTDVGGDCGAVQPCDDDRIPPVFDVADLPDVTGQCSVEVTTVPTATDNCTGSATATTTDPLSYNEQGTFVINWMYDDGNGNISTQPQIVIVDDTFAPDCPFIPNDPIAQTVAAQTKPTTLPDVVGDCEVTVIVPNALDACAGTVVGTTDDPLTYTEVGTFTISWSFDDGNENILIVEQTVIVNETEDCLLCPTDLTDTELGNFILPGLYEAVNTITSAGIILNALDTVGGGSGSSGPVEFVAGESIILNAGFTVPAGAVFSATVATPSCFEIEEPNNTEVVDRMKLLDVEMPVFIENVTLTAQPNPFYHETQLRFQIPKKQQVSLQLFDQMGRLVQTIVPLQHRTAGEHVFSLRNEQGLRGIYFVVLQTESERVVQKIMVIND